jgi:2-methylcitrate dehydratase PrpD
MHTLGARLGLLEPGALDACRRPDTGRTLAEHMDEAGFAPDRIRARERQLDPARIARITNETYDTVKSHFSAKEAATPMAARVSVPYCIAAAAVDGALTQAQFAPGRIHDPLIRRVLDRTEVIADPALNALYPANFPARVTVTMEDGQSFAETVMLPKGDPGAPLSDAELEDKFRGNCEPVLGTAQASRLRDATLRLAEGGSVEALSGLLVPGAP